jgi:uncharacterized protein (TIGR02147 family)
MMKPKNISAPLLRKLDSEVDVMNRPCIFDYIDYREFLKDMFAYKKETTPSYSYRFFSRLAGFSSPNFLKLVMEGQRNISNTSIAGIARGFKLKKPERNFFENMVFMNQAADHSERDHYYRKMIAAKSNGTVKTIETAQYEYFSRWYLPVIREMILFGERKQTAQQIAQKMIHPVRLRDVEYALQRLEDLGLICRDDQGCWQQTDTMLSTGPEVKSLLITNFHKEMIRLAEDSMARHPAKNRDITALTISMDQNRMAELKQKIADFRKDILKEFAADENSNQVVQINIQAFPLTKSGDEGDR